MLLGDIIQLPNNQIICVEAFIASRESLSLKLINMNNRFFIFVDQVDNKASLFLILISKSKISCASRVGYTITNFLYGLV